MQKIFGTDGIRCKVNQEPMTAETCLKIAKAAGYILSNKITKKIELLYPKILGYQVIFLNRLLLLDLYRWEWM